MEILSQSFGGVTEYYYLNEGGERVAHREDGPALSITQDGFLKLEAWYISGSRHNENGPAVIEYYPNGNVKEKHWYVLEEQHRTDGPAWIVYKENGNVAVEYYIQHNLYHRDVGEAVVYYD